MLPLGKCVVCLCVSAHLVRLACGHDHCRDCISRNILVSISTPPFQPARCCHKASASLELVWELASADDFETYRRLLVEYETADKLYCSVPACSAFLAPDTRVSGAAACPRCLAKTCVKCEKRWHEGDCSAQAEDAENDRRLLGLAREKAWQRCPCCRAIVSRIDGCTSMSCRCGAVFCYSCGRQTCMCHRRDDIRRQVRQRRGIVQRMLSRLF